MASQLPGRPKSAIERAPAGDDSSGARGLLWPPGTAGIASLPNARRRSYHEASSSIAPTDWPIRPHSSHQPHASFSHSAVRPHPSPHYANDRSSLGLSYAIPSSSVPDASPFDWSTSGPNSPPYVFHSAPMQPSSSVPLPTDSRPVGIPHITRSWTLDSPSRTSLALPHANFVLPLTRSPIPFSALTSRMLTVSPVTSNASGPSSSEGERRVVSLPPQALIPRLPEIPRRASGRRQGGPPKAVLGGPGGKTYEELQIEKMARIEGDASSSVSTSLLTPDRQSRETDPSPSPKTAQGQHPSIASKWRGKEIKIRLPPLHYEPPEHPAPSPLNDMPEALPQSRKERFPWPRQRILTTPESVPLPITSPRNSDQMSRARWAETAATKGKQDFLSQQPMYKGRRIKIKIPPENAWESLLVVARAALEVRKDAQSSSPVKVQESFLPALPTTPGQSDVKRSAELPPDRLLESSSSVDDLIVTPEEKFGRLVARDTFGNSGFLKRQLGGLLRTPKERRAIEVARSSARISEIDGTPSLGKRDSEAKIIDPGDLEEIPLTASADSPEQPPSGRIFVGDLVTSGLSMNERDVEESDRSTTASSDRHRAKDAQDDDHFDAADSPSRPSGTAKPPMFGHDLALQQSDGLLRPASERSKRKAVADVATTSSASGQALDLLPAQDPSETQFLSADVGVPSPASAIHELVDESDMVSTPSIDPSQGERQSTTNSSSPHGMQALRASDEHKHAEEIARSKRMRPNAPVFIPQGGPSSAASRDSVDTPQPELDKKSRMKAPLRATAAAFRPSHTPSASVATSTGSQQLSSTAFGALVRQNPGRGEFTFNAGIGASRTASDLNPTARPFSFTGTGTSRPSYVDEIGNKPSRPSTGMESDARKVLDVADTFDLSQTPFSLWGSLEEIKSANPPAGEGRAPVEGESLGTRPDSDDEDPAFGTSAGSSSALFFRSPAPSPAPSSDDGRVHIPSEMSALPLRAEASPQPVIGFSNKEHPLHPSPDPADGARSPRHERPESSRISANSHLSKEMCEADESMAATRVADVEAVTIYRSHPVGSHSVSRINVSREFMDSAAVMKAPPLTTSGKLIGPKDDVGGDASTTNHPLKTSDVSASSKHSAPPPSRTRRLSASTPAFVFGGPLQHSTSAQDLKHDHESFIGLSPAATTFEPRGMGPGQPIISPQARFPLPSKPGIVESSIPPMQKEGQKVSPSRSATRDRGPEDDHSVDPASSIRITPDMEGDEKTPTATGFITSPAFEHPMSPLSASPGPAPAPYITVDAADDDRKFRQWTFPLVALSGTAHATRPSISRRHTMPGKQVELETPGAGVASTAPDSASLATRVQDLRAFLQSYGHFAESGQTSDCVDDESSAVDLLNASNLMSGRPSVSAQSSVEFPVRQDATRAREVEMALQSPESLDPQRQDAISAEVVGIMRDLLGTLRAHKARESGAGGIENASIAEAIESGLSSVLNPVLPSLAALDNFREQLGSQVSSVDEMMTVLREQSAILNELQETAALKPPHSAFSLSPSPLSADVNMEDVNETSRTEEMFAALISGQHALMDKIGSDALETISSSVTIAAIFRTVEALRQELQIQRAAIADSSRVAEHSMEVSRQLVGAQAEIQALETSVKDIVTVKERLQDEKLSLQQQLDHVRTEVTTMSTETKDRAVELDAALAARLVAESEKEAVQKQLNEAKLLIARRDVELAKAQKQLDVERKKPPAAPPQPERPDPDGKEDFRDEVMSRLVRLDEAMHEIMSSRVKEYSQVLDRNRILQAEVDSLRQRVEASAEKFAALQLSTTTTLSEVDAEQRITRDKMEEAQMAREAAERLSESLQVELQRMKEEGEVWKMMARERQATSRLQEMRLHGLAQEVHHWKTFALEIDRSQFKAFVKRNPSLVKKEASAESSAGLTGGDSAADRKEDGGTWYGVPSVSKSNQPQEGTTLEE